MPNTGSCCPGPWLPTPAVSGPALNRTLTQQAVSILAMYGADAHLYLPGVGMLNGLTAGNYLTNTFSPLAGIDTAVGGVLDAQGDLGAELLPNGFTGGTVSGGTTIVDGIVNINLQSTGLAAYVDNTPGFAAGKVYRVSVTATDLTQTTGVRFQGVAIATAEASEGVVAYTRTFVAPTLTNSRIDVTATGTVTRGTIAVSIREVQGIHATQPTAANRPMLRRGAVNLLTYSQDFTNAAWSKANLTATSGVLARTGVGNAYAQSASFVSALPIGTKFTAAARVKASNIGGGFGLRTTGTYPDRSDGIFNLNTGSVIGWTNGGLFTDTTATIAPDTEGYYLCVVTGTAGGSAAIANILGPCETTASSGGWEAGSAVLSNCIISAAALFQGTYTAAQIQALGGIPLTTTAPASTALGSYFWEFDGVNDSLSLSAPLFQMADDFVVVTAVKRQSRTATWETCFSAFGGVSFLGLFSNNSGQAYFSVYNDAGQQHIVGVTAAPVWGSNYVQTGLKRTGSMFHRLNSVVQQSRPNPTGTYTWASSSIGSAGGNAGPSPARGNIYPVVAIKGTVTDSDLLTLERFIGSLSGVTI